MNVWRAFAITILCGSAGASIQPLHAQSNDSSFTNSIGMQFIRVQPGRVIIGRFQPACPVNPALATAAVSAVAPVVAVSSATNTVTAPAAVTGGRGGAGGRSGARAPVDPRARWTDADYALCAELVKRDALPGFTVRIDHAFFLGKFEVTQAQYTQVMGANPSVFSDTRLKHDASANPVDNVSFSDAQKFISKLNQLDKSSRYRLPTEFEWEYAAGASRQGEPGWAEVRNAAWIQDSDKGTTHAVGTKTANAWGFYDMLGNVWEWVGDEYNEQLFADSIKIKRKLRDAVTHVLKGGSFVSDVKNATWTTHAGGPGSGFDVGFRVVREPRN